MHSICNQTESFKLPLAFDSFWQVFGGILELKKNLGPKIEKQFLKTSDTGQISRQYAAGRSGERCAPYEVFFGRAFWILHVKTYSCRYL